MKAFFESMYGRARGPDDLPWHREFIPPHLAAGADRPAGGRALDLGCGTGVYSTYLARRGWAVTAVDFVPQALDMARDRAKREGVAVEFVHADVLEWAADAPFDFVFDSGCLHGMAKPEDRARYKKQLLGWLAPGGAFAITHFYRRHPLDWRPMGPRRWTRPEVVALFVPELTEREFHQEVTRTPLPVGPTVKLGYYLFDRKAPAEAAA